VWRAWRNVTHLPLPGACGFVPDRILSDLRYIVFLSREAVRTASSIAARYGGSVISIPDADRLLEVIAFTDGDCLVIDPALITPAMAETLAITVTRFPRPVVAFSSIATDAMESVVILARHSRARFIFRGATTERSALEHALLLTPDVKLRAALLSGIDAHMARLPSIIEDRLRDAIMIGDGAHSPDTFAAMTGLARRSIDRHLADAGFVSGKRLLDAWRIVAGYRAITRSRVPLGRIARALGCTMRVMDAQFVAMVGVTCSELRAEPMAVEEVAERMARQLTEPLTEPATER
jgi:hypothetical protein